MTLNYSTVSQLRRHHPAWRLLLADHAPLIASFLDATFIQPNVRTLGESQLRARLDDMLFQLRDTEGESAFPRSGADYLNDWADNDKRVAAQILPTGFRRSAF